MRYLYDMKSGSMQANIINSNIEVAQELEKKLVGSSVTERMNGRVL